MFRDKTYENILDEILEMAPEDIDTRKGGIYYYHVAPVAFMISRYYSELQITIDLISIDTAEGEYLDQKANEHNLERIPAQPSIRNGIFDGTNVAENMRFFANDFYFKLVYNENGQLVLEAEIGGETPNNIPTGTELVPVNTVQGLKSAKLGTVITPGTETETDENLRRRLREKIAGPAENGNAQHYKSWCESVQGVGLARIDSLWNGKNTVKGIIVGADGLGATPTIVDDVQRYVDPGSLGLGEGAANIGAFFTAVSAENTEINISFDVQLSVAANLEDVKNKVSTALIEYFKTVSLESRDKSDMVIRASAISNVIYSTDGVIDYSNLLINGNTANVIVPFTNAPKLGVLTIEQI
ncbi:baseplate J/gp47 family protein [Anaerovorax sp. IOR16]|uniref:baseplate J/gp47 family protein n=1 Tax=Anaerovorax sp. IOR16 TaxID=2773458 RepID=UPI0019D29AA6|nr:baseplate J/gp47 family protein [Anaerovorax sp. IOR16]